MTAPPSEQPAHAPASRSQEVRGDFIGPYRLCEPIGQGGFGTVWLAERLAPMHQRVALKVIRPGMDSEAVVARFEQERQALAVMDHPNVARVFDGGTTPAGHPYFVMEYVQGEPITAYCDRHRLPVRRRLEVFLAVCDAVQHAHFKGLIHRDLKPGNVLVQNVDGLPVPKVIDFGIAKALGTNPLLDGAGTVSGQVIGTPEYMSPEQAAGSADVDARTDVYSLGVLLYELLVGVKPFDEATLRRAALDEMLRVIREQDPARPSTRLHSLGSDAPAVAESRASTPADLARQVRRELEWIPLMALRKDRERRYPSPSALADDIRRYLGGRALAAGPESRIYRARKFVRRHRLPVLAALAVTGALVAGVVGTSIGLVGEQRQRRLADQRAREARWRQYVADIAAADASLRAGEGAAARVRLASTPEELRNWEWRALHAGADRSVLVLKSAGPFASEPALSADGRSLLARAGYDGVQVWDRATGRSLRVLRPDSGRLKASAVHEGLGLVAVSSTVHSVTVWSLDREQPLRTFAGLEADATSLLFSPDGSRLACGLAGGVAHLWHLETGDRLTLPDHPHGITAMAFSSDGTRLACGAARGSVRIWDAASGALRPSPRETDSGIRSLAFSPDGSRLCSAAEDGTVRLWDSASGALAVPLHGHRKTVFHTAFSADGAHLVTSSTDRTVRVWDAGTGRCTAVLEHPGTPANPVFIPGGRLATGCDDGTLRVWDLQSQREAVVLRGHDSGISALALVRDPPRLISTGWTNDSTVRLWDLNSTPDPVVLRTGDGAAEAIAFSPDGAVLVVGSWGGSVTLWDAASGDRMALLSGHADRVWSVAFSPDGACIASASWDRTARVWDSASGAERLVLAGHHAPVRGVAFTPDNRTIVTTDAEGAVIAWDAATGERTASFSSVGAPTTPPTMHPRRAVLGLGGLGGSISVLDALSGAALTADRRHSTRVYRLCFDPAGERLASGGADDTVKIWDLTGTAEITTIPAAEGAPFGLAWSPDATRLAVGAGRSVHLWDTESWTDVATLRGHDGAVRCVVFSPDGRRLASSDDAGAVLVRDTAPETLRAAERDAAAGAEPAARILLQRALDGRRSPDGAHWLRWADAPPLERRVAQRLLLGLGAGSDPEDRLVRAVEDAASTFGPAHWETRRKRMALAEHHRTHQRYDDALAIITEVLAQAAAENPETVEVQWTMAIQAWVEEMRGRPEVAADLYRRAAAISARVLGENDDETLMRRENLAHVLYRLGRYAEAEELLVPLVETRRLRLGAGATPTLRVRDLLDECRLRGGSGADPEGNGREN